MILYALRHKPSGHFLPPFRGKAGGTWVEPTEGCVPRVFHRVRDAKSYLSVWLKGGITVKEYQTYEGDWDVDITTEEKPERKREDMEIVILALTIQGVYK